MIHRVETQILILLLVASVVAIGARFVRLPYTLALVVAGLLLGFVHLPALGGLELSADLLLLLLLPALLFEAALHIEWKEFRREAAAIMTLAAPGVLVAGAVSATLVYFTLAKTGLAEGFGLAHALIFAAVVAATDPISVLALFRELGVPHRLYLLVEGESLLNDGVAVVVFVIVLGALGVPWAGQEAPELHGARDIASHAIVTFVRMAAGGVLIGGVLGTLASATTRQLDDPLIEITLTMLVAYGSFFIAELVHCSGVLSTVAAGIIMGSLAAPQGMSPKTKVAVEDFWEYMAFLANSFIFLLVGIQLDPARLIGSLGAIFVGFAAMMLARAVAVYTLVPLAARLVRRPIPMAWRHVLVVGGLRGSLSMVLVLALPSSFVGKDVLSAVVFGVVALSLFVQGLSMKPLLRRLNLLHGPGAHIPYESARARELVARGSLREIDELHREGTLSAAARDQLRDWYGHLRTVAHDEVVAQAGRSDLDEQIVEGLRRLAAGEREALRRYTRAGLIGERAASDLEADVIERVARLEAAAREGDDARTAHLKRLLAHDPPPEDDPPA